jgi:hypothetical protein
VPKGIPAAGLGGFSWLARNQYGAIDMSQYSPAQWLATGLPYCRQCMSHPGEVHFLTDWLWDPWNSHWTLEPCPHGHIVTAQRLAQHVEAKKRRDIFWSILFVLVGGLFLVDISWAVLLVLTALAVVAFRYYRRQAKKVIECLVVHPEVAGFWERNRAEYQTWLSWPGS